MSNKYEKHIETMFEEYQAAVELYAEEVFYYRIKPWLENFHLKFVAGMGGYSIRYTDQTPAWFVARYRDQWIHNTENLLDKDKLDTRIIQILSSDVEGLPGNDFGSLMPEFSPETETPLVGG